MHKLVLVISGASYLNCIASYTAGKWWDCEKFSGCGHTNKICPANFLRMLVSTVSLVTTW